MLAAATASARGCAGETAVARSTRINSGRISQFGGKNERRSLNRHTVEADERRHRNILKKDRKASRLISIGRGGLALSKTFKLAPDSSSPPERRINIGSIGRSNQSAEAEVSSQRGHAEIFGRKQRPPQPLRRQQVEQQQVDE